MYLLFLKFYGFEESFFYIISNSPSIWFYIVLNCSYLHLDIFYSSIFGMKSIMYSFFLFFFNYFSILFPKLIVIPWLSNNESINNVSWLKCLFFLFFFVSRVFLLFNWGFYICFSFYNLCVHFYYWEIVGNFTEPFACWSYWPFFKIVKDRALIIFLLDFYFIFLLCEEVAWYYNALAECSDAYLLIIPLLF